MAPATSSSTTTKNEKRSRLICVPEAVVNKTSSASSSSSSSSSSSLHLGQVLALGHPRGGKPAQYLLTPEGNFCELQSFQPSGSKFGSWFVEQKIVTDGRLFVASPLDPKFLLLPVLERHGAQRYSPLEQILAAEAGGAYMPLRACHRLELHRICDVNDQLGDDMLLFRLNTEKTLNWLAQKVERTKKALVALEVAREGQNTGIGSGFAAGFMIQTATTATTTTTAAAAEAKAAVPMREATREEARTALELVSDYLTDEWAQKLQKHCGFSEDEMKQGTAAPKRSAWDGEAEAEQDTAMELTQGKRFKADGSANAGAASGGGAGGGSSGAKSGAGGGGGGASVAHKKLAKTNLKGVKSISSFFGKRK